MSYPSQLKAEFDMDLVRSEGIQREIRGSGWRNGRRHQAGAVQCCNALSVQAVVMPEIDSGGGGSDSFIMCLGRHWGDTPHRPGVMMIHWMVNNNYGT